MAVASVPVELFPLSVEIGPITGVLGGGGGGSSAMSIGWLRLALLVVILAMQCNNEFDSFYLFTVIGVL